MKLKLFLLTLCVAFISMPCFSQHCYTFSNLKDKFRDSVYIVVVTELDNGNVEVQMINQSMKGDKLISKAPFQLKDTSEGGFSFSESEKELYTSIRFGNNSLIVNVEEDDYYLSDDYYAWIFGVDTGNYYHKRYELIPLKQDEYIYEYNRLKKALSRTNSKALGLCPDEYHPHAIDLGLPSGTKWACCYVGANYPENFGIFFGWGEVNHKMYLSDFTSNNYEHNISKNPKKSKFADIGRDISGTKFDISTLAWGDFWRMPTKEQCQELALQCTITKETINNVKGYRYKGANGNSVFMPLSGCTLGSHYMETGGLTYIWTSSAYKNLWAFTLEVQAPPFYKNKPCSPAFRSNGYLVRPVKK